MATPHLADNIINARCEPRQDGANPDGASRALLLLPDAGSTSVHCGLLAVRALVFGEGGSAIGAYAVYAGHL
jgi:hypothetical protein